MMFLGMNSSKLHTNFCWSVHRSDLGGVHKSDLGTLLDSSIFCRLTPYVSVQGNLIFDHLCSFFVWSFFHKLLKIVNFTLIHTQTFLRGHNIPCAFELENQRKTNRLRHMAMIL